MNPLDLNFTSGLSAARAQVPNTNIANSFSTNLDFGSYNPNTQNSQANLIKQITANNNSGNTLGVGTSLDNSQDNPFTTRDKFDIGLGLAQTGLQGYLGLKSAGLAEDTLDFQKQAFQANLQASTGEYNRQLASQYDRQFNFSGQQAEGLSREDYLKKYSLTA